MANPEKSVLEKLLTCPVCQDIFNEPRQLPCGHSFCMSCLEGMAGFSSDVPFRCPDCRAYFGTVVGVQKSYALANIAEDYKDNQKQKSMQMERVYCDCCPDEDVPAARTCLKCEVSLCELHIRDHLELPAYLGHPVVQPLADLRNRKCPQHDDEVLKYYCSTSRRYVCNVCALENKQTNMATEASSIVGRKLTEYMDQQFRSLEERINECSNSMNKVKQELQKENQKVNPNESWLNGVTVVLLCLWFIVLYYAGTYSLENQSLRETHEKQQIRLHHIYSKIGDFLANHQPMANHSVGSAGTEDVVSLDLDSASPYLQVSLDLQSVERVKAKLTLPSHASRFDEAPQILLAQCYSAGTHTWSVEAVGYWDIAVAHSSIPRKSKDHCVFGNNAMSWSLTHNGKGQLSAYHNKVKTVLHAALTSHLIQVTVSFGKGSITFREGGDVNTLLHEFQAKLSQPVCLGFGLYRADPPSRVTVLTAN